MKKLLVAVPAYNCSNQILRVMDQFIRLRNDLFSELLVIDNCSEDDTAEKVLKKTKMNQRRPITLMKNIENFGLGGTHKVAFDYCLKKKYDGVVILHGDDQGSLADIVPFLINDNFHFDCLLGSRFMKGSNVNGYSFIRCLGNYAFNFLYSLITFNRITDMGSGLNYYSINLICSDVHKNMPDDLTFNNAYLLALIALKKKIKFIPISWREEDQISNAKLWSQSLNLLKYLLMFIFKRSNLVYSDLRKNKIKNYDSELLISNL
jgi:glycosyltransferase involved in cell wall biosynthesis